MSDSDIFVTNTHFKSLGKFELLKTVERLQSLEVIAQNTMPHTRNSMSPSATANSPVKKKPVPNEKPTPSPKPDTPLKLSNLQLNAKVAEQDALIKQLLVDRVNDSLLLENFRSRIVQLEHDQIKTQSLLLVKDRVTELLSERITQLEQYTRRYSVIVKGIEKKRGENYENLREEVEKVISECNSTTTINDVDKFHRNGKRVGDVQDVIIRFKSHSAKEAFYKKRKTIRRVNSGTIKIQPSLTFERKKMFGEAVDFIKSFQSEPDAHPNPPDFILADVHGNLMVKMKEVTVHGSMFVKFDSLHRLLEIISENNVDYDASKEFEKVRIP